MKNNLKLSDISADKEKQLAEIDPNDLMPLPPPYDKAENEPGFKQLSEDQKNRLVHNLDGIVSLNLPKPQNEEEERKYVSRFITGLKKLLSRENNWTFLQPFLLSLNYCANCQTCNDSCQTYVASGRNDIYRPTYRSEIFRKIIKRYTGVFNRLLDRLIPGRKEKGLNWATVSRLYELAYRCNLCRRCVQACPMGVDNALISRELRKLFSQELGWAPKALHEKGTVLQLQVGSPTGMKSYVVKDNVQFLDEDFSGITGTDVKTPWDIENADALIIHSAGDIISWPESPIGFTILLNAAGLSWTLASEAPGFDGVNYGLFYDDFQLAKVAVRHAQVAKKLKVKKIVMGECGHQHKAFMTVADRVLTGDLNIPREGVMTFLEDIVFSGKVRFDPSRNNFPVTLHDPCNIVRNLGIVEPQRRILRYLCPQFREMTPHGIENYCCGGGGGLSVMSETNFPSWKASVAGRMKFRQVLEAFSDCPGPEVKKYVCAPCLNCKLQFRDIFEYFKAKERSGLYFGGIVELIVNAMADLKEPFIRWGEL